VIITRHRFGVQLVAFRKSAHTSIVNTFCSRAGEDVVRGSSNYGYDDADTTSITVAFFRNPLARLVSAYNHLVCAEDGLHSGLQKFGYQHGMDFGQFIDLTLSIPDNKIDLHLRSQTWQLCEALEHHYTTVVWLGQVEQLPAHWRQMQNFTAIWDTPDAPPMFNGRLHRPWPMYYTVDLAHRVLTDRYFDDYKTWQSRLWQ
jgi:hypothetical protein